MISMASIDVFADRNGLTPLVTYLRLVLWISIELTETQSPCNQKAWVVSYYTPMHRSPFK